MGVSRALRLLATSVFAGAVLFAPAAHGRPAATPTIVVNFTQAGAVTVALPSGTPLGTTSGTPTMIPGGYYSLLLNGPGDCISLPLFELKGPGIDYQDDMMGGEVDTHSVPLYFVPNSTYTWHIDRNQAVVYTFRTSADVVGTPPTGGLNTSHSGKPVATSQDIVGSAILPFRGTLTGAVTAAGRLTLAYKGKGVTSLKAGRYLVAVTDKSSSNGFLLAKLRHSATSVTGTAFIGKRSASIRLTAGKWLVMPRLGHAAYTIYVN
jgi:hypothetical protein